MCSPDVASFNSYSENLSNDMQIFKNFYLFFKLKDSSFTEFCFSVKHQHESAVGHEDF